MKFNRQFLKDGLVWGFILWSIGYALGVIFFMIVPENLIGFVIMPIGTAITLWVLINKIKSDQIIYYLWLSIFWTLIAIILDYLFIVKAFNSENYYKLDVYFYYFLTFILPLIVGWRKTQTIKDKIENES